MTNQTVQGQYLDRRQTASSRRRCRSRSIPTRAAITPITPGNLFVANWNGVVSNRFFATAQYSRKTNHPRFGNTSTRLQDSPFLTIGRVVARRPAFRRAVLRSHRSGRSRQQPADRQRVVVRIAARAGARTTSRAASSVFSLGCAAATRSRPPGYIFNTDYLTAAGRPVTDASRPRHPGVDSRRDDARQHAADARRRARHHDDVVLRCRIAGRSARADARSRRALRARRAAKPPAAPPASAPVRSCRAWPRRTTLRERRPHDARRVLRPLRRHATRRTTSASNTPVGNSGRVTRTYNGPAGPGLRLRAGATTWRTTRSRRDRSRRRTSSSTTICQSPLTREFTLSAAQELGGKGAVRATYVWRKATGNFIEIVHRQSDGRRARRRSRRTARRSAPSTTSTTATPTTPSRSYQGARVPGQLSPALELDGRRSLDGAAAERRQLRGRSRRISPASARRSATIPRSSSQRATSRWAASTTSSGTRCACGRSTAWTSAASASFDVAPMWRYNSALTYSLAANSVPLSAIQRARNPGYARLPGSGTNGSQTLFFGERGSEEFAGYGLVDLGVTYQVPVWRALRPWLEARSAQRARTTTS